MSAASDSAALASLEQAVLANPAWPAIPGKNKWGALPPELQPIMAEIDETIWDVSVDFWVNLVIVGIIGFDWLASLPSDVIYVFWPELRRVMGWKNGHLGSLPLGSAPLLSPQGKDVPRRRQRRWPYPIIVCHLLARIVAPIYMAATINNYRTPPSCHDAFIAYLVIVAVAACNGQVMLTLRAVAITHPLPYHRIICIVLWVLNVVIAAAWLAFAFTSQPTGKCVASVVRHAHCELDRLDANCPLVCQQPCDSCALWLPLRLHLRAKYGAQVASDDHLPCHIHAGQHRLCADIGMPQLSACTWDAARHQSALD